MTVQNEGITTLAGPLPDPLFYNSNRLKSFSTSAIVGLATGLVLTAATAGLALGYGYRIKVIHDVMGGTATFQAAHNADLLVTWMDRATLVMTVAWIVALVRWVKRSHRLVGIEDHHDNDLRRRLFKQVLKQNPDWKLFRLWQRSFWVYAVLWVLRFAIPATGTGTLVRMESLNRRCLIINAVYAVLTLVIAVLGWRAKKAVEVAARRTAIISSPVGY